MLAEQRAKMSKRTFEWMGGTVDEMEELRQFARDHWGAERIEDPEHAADNVIGLLRDHEQWPEERLEALRPLLVESAEKTRGSAR